MVSAQLGFLLAVLTVSAWGQIQTPFISREGILPAKGPQWLEPDQFVAIYGRNLAPRAGCSERLEPKAGFYPTDFCDTRVTVNGIRAGLQFVGEGQINIKLPAGIPSVGIVAIAVTVRGVSSQEVTVPIGKPNLTLSVVGHAYIHMPVWIAHNVPVPYRDEILQPFGMSGGKFEVRRNGVMLKPPLEVRPPRAYAMPGNGGGVVLAVDTPLPLHLQYRFDEPGKYEIRYIGTQMKPDPPRGMRTVVAEQSDWTSIEVEPFSDAQRTEWIRERARKMPSSPEQLIGKAIPELLALPDAAALSAILPQIYHSQESVRRYVAASLAMFDGAVVAKQLTPMVREKGPTEEIARLLDENENLFEGGHEAIMAALPEFLKLPSALPQAGALQYIVWEPLHDWGKTAELQARRGALVMDAAPGILERGDEHIDQLLAQALGSIKTDAARDMLWSMVEGGKAAGQSKIALTWIGDARDLPRLARSMDVSLAYSLHHAYGDAALPWLKKAARETNQPALRQACARELVIAGEPEGFQYLLQAMDDMPSFRREAVQFVRDRFPVLRDADEGKVLDFVRKHAITAR
ncbi:MAG TPA: hypothetical protein VHY84_24475 [Bryobacteraceae bacterium]|jgi:hypothetical protein|nr:hypothetical protein [Bryobacteraceae bacterium]